MRCTDHFSSTLAFILLIEHLSDLSWCLSLFWIFTWQEMLLISKCQWWVSGILLNFPSIFVQYHSMESWEVLCRLSIVLHFFWVLWLWLDKIFYQEHDERPLFVDNDYSFIAHFFSFCFIHWFFQYTQSDFFL